MAQFFKYFLATVIGVLVSLFIVILIGGGILATVATQTEKTPEVKANSVLKISFDQTIPELTNNVQMTNFELEPNQVLGLGAIIKTLEKAQSDERIKGIYLELDQVKMGFSTAHQLHEALMNFREAGKFIIAYGKYFSQGAYYMASTAQPIILNPSGMIDLRGLSTEIPFFKNLLDKSGVQLQVYYAGQFKSATEPYRLTKMSAQNRLQVHSFLGQIYHQFTADLAMGRELSQDFIKGVANEYLAAIPEDAVELKIIDQLGYEDEALAQIREAAGLEEDEKIPFVSLADYHANLTEEINYRIKDKVAVVYAEGAIVIGKGENGNIGDDKYVKLLNSLYKEDQVKAVVLRVNSPGGSALASENILRVLERIRASGRPVVVSMGDYGASGGYYIACQSDSILVQENTLTGSIGVFSIIPNMQGLFNNHLGITFDTVKTGQYANGISVAYQITPEEGRKIQAMTDRTYEQFLAKVSANRNMTRDEVHAIAQGRVWTGQQAVENGLADGLGTLEDAIAIAADKARLEQYRLTVYPKVKDPFMQLVEDLTGNTIQTMIEKKIKASFPALSAHLPWLNQPEEWNLGTMIQAGLPFAVGLN
jgi:protease-4